VEIFRVAYRVVVLAADFRGVGVFAVALLAARLDTFRAAGALVEADRVVVLRPPVRGAVAVPALASALRGVVARAVFLRAVLLRAVVSRAVVARAVVWPGLVSRAVVLRAVVLRAVILPAGDGVEGVADSVFAAPRRVALAGVDLTALAAGSALATVTAAASVTAAAAFWLPVEASDRAARVAAAFCARTLRTLAAAR
jgi:hypothetical protein